MNHDLVLRGAIKNEIGIGRSHHAAQTTFGRKLASVRIPQQEIDDSLNARLRATAALRRMFLDIAQNLTEFGGGAKGIAKLHSPCFAQMARICSSVANSPRSACARDSSNELSSAVSGAQSFLLGRQLERRLILAGELQEHAREGVLNFRRQNTRGFNRLIQKLRHA